MEGYGRIYQSVMRDPDITIEAKAVYGYLSALAGADVSCYPSVEIMQRELAIGKNRLQRCIRELTSKGIIAVRQERSGNRYGKNIYELCHFQGLRFQSLQSQSLQIEATEKTPENTQERHFEATEFQSPQNEAHTNNSINNNNMHSSTISQRGESKTGLPRGVVILPDGTYGIDCNL